MHKSKSDKSSETSEIRILARTIARKLTTEETMLISGACRSGSINGSTVNNDQSDVPGLIC